VKNKCIGIAYRSGYQSFTALLKKAGIANMDLLTGVLNIYKLLFFVTPKIPKFDLKFNTNLLNQDNHGF